MTERTIKISWSHPESKRKREEDDDYAELFAGSDDDDAGDVTLTASSCEAPDRKLSINTRFLGRMVSGVERQNVKLTVDSTEAAGCRLDGDPADLGRFRNKAEGRALIERIAQLYGLRVHISEQDVRDMSVDARTLLPQSVSTRASKGSNGTSSGAISTAAPSLVSMALERHSSETGEEGCLAAIDPATDARFLLQQHRKRQLKQAAPGKSSQAAGYAPQVGRAAMAAADGAAIHPATDARAILQQQKERRLQQAAPRKSSQAAGNVLQVGKASTAAAAADGVALCPATDARAILQQKRERQLNLAEAGKASQVAEKERRAAAVRASPKSQERRLSGGVATGLFSRALTSAGVSREARAQLYKPLK